MHHVKKTFLTKLKTVNNKKIADFINSAEGTVIMWKRDDSNKKGMLLSAAIGYYLFGGNYPIFEKVKKHVQSLKEKIKNTECESKIQEEINFLEDVIKDIENIYETSYLK